MHSASCKITYLHMQYELMDYAIESLIERDDINDENTYL